MASPNDVDRVPRRRAALLRSGWLGGIRFSGFSVILLLLIVLAVVVIAPSVTALVTQRQQIDAARSDVAGQRDDVSALESKQRRWSDETFVKAQARERLYYVMPGEVSYLVIDDRVGAAADGGAAPVSKTVARDRTDWMGSLLASLVTAGTAPLPADADDPGPSVPPTAPPSAPAAEESR